MTAPLTLVVLAAGLGSRYGGLKQLDPLGPGGNTLMDYAVYDGWRAGFSRVVFVIRPEMETTFRERVASRYRDRLSVETAFQRADDLPGDRTVPPSRTKPWGTTHAVLAARAGLQGPFAVLNADDFYGRSALASIAEFLRAQPEDARTHAVVGYRLDATASPAGGVNRALLIPGPDGLLAFTRELRGLVQHGLEFVAEEDPDRRRVPPDALVSMNLWGFMPSILPGLTESFTAFLDGAPGDREECYLPDALQTLIASGSAAVRVIPTTDRWCGVTYAEDREWVRAALELLVARGDYPERLWE